MVEDYRATGLTARRHPLALLRPVLGRLGYANARRLDSLATIEADASGSDWAERRLDTQMRFGGRSRAASRRKPGCQTFGCSGAHGQQAIRHLARAMVGRTGNLPPLPGIFPDHPASMLRNQPDEREVMLAH